MTIALCMIVRDEAAVIERCIASARDLVDAWVVCDTGCTDDTPARAAAALDGIPGRLHRIPWVDFAQARTQALALARGVADHLLLLDADMELVRHGPLPPLDADAYTTALEGPGDAGAYRLLRGDRGWWFEGAARARAASNGRVREGRLDALTVVHHADGTPPRARLLRDAGLLKRDLRRDPANPRTVFQLAECFDALGEPALAQAWYRRRVELGGWQEEAFAANLREGVLRADDDLDAALPLLLAAWQRRPSRAEPLHALARAYRVRGDLDVAELFARRGLELGATDDTLAVDPAVRERLRAELALIEAARA